MRSSKEFEGILGGTQGDDRDTSIPLSNKEQKQEEQPEEAGRFSNRIKSFAQEKQEKLTDSFQEAMDKLRRWRKVRCSFHFRHTRKKFPVLYLYGGLDSLFSDASKTLFKSTSLYSIFFYFLKKQ